jgi:hypothetical protein
VEVTDLDVEEEPTDEAQYRVAQVAMEGRHGARLDPAREPVAHYEIGSRPQLTDERRERGEVIAVVSVNHDHILAPGRHDSAE